MLGGGGGGMLIRAIIALNLKFDVTLRYSKIRFFVLLLRYFRFP